MESHLFQEEQLAKARTERDSRRQQKEKTTNEKDKLLAHVDLLKRLLLSHSSSGKTHSDHPFISF